MVPFIIYFLVPLAGLANFVLLRRRMLAREVPRPPVVELFVLHALYGGVLLILLTSLFWYWSGMASLGTFFLVLVAPLIALVQAWLLRRRRTLSNYHRRALTLSWLYPLVVLALIFGSLGVARHRRDRYELPGEVTGRRE